MNFLQIFLISRENYDFSFSFKSLKAIIWYVLLSLLFVLNALRSLEHLNLFYGDVYNFLVLNLFFFQLYFHRKKNDILGVLQKYWVNITLFLSFIGILKFILIILVPNSFSFFESIGLDRSSALSSDNNFFALALLLGLLSYLFFSFSKNTKLRSSNLVLYILAILLTFSRRGVLVLLIITSIILISVIYNSLKRKKLANQKVLIKSMALSIVLPFIVIISFVKFTSYSQKHHLISMLNHSPTKYQKDISIQLKDYYTFGDSIAKVENINKQIWHNSIYNESTSNKVVNYIDNPNFENNAENWNFRKNALVNVYRHNDKQMLSVKSKKKWAGIITEVWLDTTIDYTFSTKLKFSEK